MKNSYDYGELIAELHEELEDGELYPGSIIQVLRADKPVFDLYRPIIDWYYDRDAMEEMLSDMDDSEINQYHKDQPALEQVTVSACLAEMEEVNRII
jgi:hypothetical protein